MEEYTNNSGTYPQGGQEQRCPKCGAPRIAGASFCEDCGTKFADAPSVAQPGQYQQPNAQYRPYPQYPQYPPYPPQPYAPVPQKKSHTGLIVAIVAICVVLFFLIPIILGIVYGIRMASGMIENGYFDEFINNYANYEDYDDSYYDLYQSAAWQGDAFIASLPGADPSKIVSGKTFIEFDVYLSVFVVENGEKRLLCVYEYSDDGQALYIYDQRDYYRENPLRVYSHVGDRENSLALRSSDGDKVEDVTITAAQPHSQYLFDPNAGAFAFVPDSAAVG
ncbi:MAG: zinc ribbon domain-containing protein [Clostridia bacterium]|nr:zinc ribbon domain-containing protein [Clostridia bacterium]